MKSKFVKRSSSKRLIQIFAGWGMDWRPFAKITHPGYDILVIWDYRQLTFNWKPLFRYEEICLIAWSMGVFVASVTMHEISPRVTMRIAVNGTLTPIDDALGISPAVWRGTLNALSPTTWRKFQRRMCDSQAQYAEFSQNSPKRTMEDLKEELEALEIHTIFHVEQISDWDMAVISRHDAIFPTDNQLAAWQNTAPVRILEAGHLPDFQQLIQRLIIDKNRVGECFLNARSTYAENALVQREIAQRLMQEFDKVYGEDRIVGNIIEIGPGADGFLTFLWIRRIDPRAKTRLWDLVDVAPAEPLPPNIEYEVCDAEIRIKRQPSDSVGFIFSSSTVQWFNSLRDFLTECQRVLVPGGYLILSSFVHGNLQEITSITGNGLQLPTLSGWRKIVPSDMEILVCEEDMYRLSFDSPREALQHFRNTGVNGVVYGQSSVVLARKLLENYPLGLDTQKYDVTYRPVFLIARRKEVQ